MGEKERTLGPFLCGCGQSSISLSVMQLMLLGAGFVYYPLLQHQRGRQICINIFNSTWNVSKIHESWWPRNSTCPCANPWLKRYISNHSSANELRTALSLLSKHIQDKVFFPVCKSKQIKKSICSHKWLSSLATILQAQNPTGKMPLGGRNRQCVDQENPGKDYKGIRHTGWALNEARSLWKPALWHRSVLSGPPSASSAPGPMCSTSRNKPCGCLFLLIEFISPQQNADETCRLNVWRQTGTGACALAT